MGGFCGEKAGEKQGKAGENEENREEQPKSKRDGHRAEKAIAVPFISIWKKETVEKQSSP